MNRHKPTVVYHGRVERNCAKRRKRLAKRRRKKTCHLVDTVAP